MVLNDSLCTFTLYRKKERNGAEPRKGILMLMSDMVSEMTSVILVYL